MDNGFFELVKSRQSCRDFNDEKVDRNDILKALETARLSPSACNSQPWKIYLVTSEKKVKEVAKSLQDDGVNSFTDKAKAFIVLAEKDATLKERISKRLSSNFFIKYDIGELIAYITLSLKSVGLESCIIGWINQEKLRNAVPFSEDEVGNIVIAVGHSDIAIREKSRRKLDEILTEI